MGDLAQCRGIADHLGAQTTEITVRPSKLAAFTGKLGRDRDFDGMIASTSNIPSLVLSSGRRTVPYIKALKKRWGSATLTVFLKDPRTGANTADLIWVPTHDKLRGANVITTDTAPHGWTQPKRAKQGSNLRAQLSRFPRPWLGVVLGGVTKRVDYGPATIEALTQAAANAAQGAGSVIITPSRRTPDALKVALSSIHRHTWVWDGTRDNPYPGMLGACDAFLVTGDSHNMVSEVLSAGRHTMVFRPDGLPKKFHRFLDGIEASGHTQPTGLAQFNRTQASLDATPEIASAIKRALERAQALDT